MNSTHRCSVWTQANRLKRPRQRPVSTGRMHSGPGGWNREKNGEHTACRLFLVPGGGGGGLEGVDVFIYLFIFFTLKTSHSLSTCFYLFECKTREIS